MVHAARSRIRTSHSAAICCDGVHRCKRHVTLGTRRGILGGVASAVWMVLAIALATPALGGDDAAIRDLASSDLAVRRKAVGALAGLPILPAEAIAPLVERLRDPDFVVADAAVRALGHGGAAARAALEPLLSSSDRK